MTPEQAWALLNVDQARDATRVHRRRQRGRTDDGLDPRTEAAFASIEQLARLYRPIPEVTPEHFGSRGSVHDDDEMSAAEVAAELGHRSTRWATHLMRSGAIEGAWQIRDRPGQPWRCRRSAFEAYLTERK